MECLFFVKKNCRDIPYSNSAGVNTHNFQKGKPAGPAQLSIIAWPSVQPATISSHIRIKEHLFSSTPM